MGLAIVNRVPMGWEVVEPRDAPRGSPNPDPGGKFYDLTGLSIEAALDKIVSLMPEYMWSKDAGVYHVRPKSFQGRASVALNRPVDKLDAAPSSVAAALAVVHGIFDAAYVFRGAGSTAPDRFKDIMNKPTTIALQTVWARDVLDEIVLQNGGSAWPRGTETPQPGTPASSSSFRGFDGWNVQMPAQIR